MVRDGRSYRTVQRLRSLQPTIEEGDELAIIAPLVGDHERFQRRLAFAPIARPPTQQLPEVVEISRDGRSSDLVPSRQVTRQPECTA